MRDILPEEALWRERIVGDVGAYFAQAGYAPIETPVLECRELLTEADAAPESTFRLFDGDGSQLMLRPDVTLPVTRLVSSRLRGQAGPFRLRYAAPVFAERDSLRGESRQFTQLGIELIGQAGSEADAEVLHLAAGALDVAGVGGYVVALGSVRPLEALLELSGAPEGWRAQVRMACRHGDFVALDELVAQAGDDVPSQVGRALVGLPRIHGGAGAIGAARDLLEPCAALFDGETGTAPDWGLDELEGLVGLSGLADRVTVDFSLMGSFGYYTGMVFALYQPGLGTCLGSGGRYDRVFERYGSPRPAAGFALSLEAVQAALGGTDAAGRAGASRPLRIAVPKGALLDGTLDALAACGLDVSCLRDAGRQLIVRSADDAVEYVIVRPTDAPAFVAFGGADCGICGRDSLVEAGLDVLQLADLRYGGCRFVVAEPDGARRRIEESYRRLGSIRVATKYPRIARAHFAKMGVEADILKFHGNIELAPLIGMADQIVDITATGTTLRENNLVVVDEVMACTARFFANPASARTDPRVFGLAQRLAANAT